MTSSEVRCKKECKNLGRQNPRLWSFIKLVNREMKLLPPSYLVTGLGSFSKNTLARTSNRPLISAASMSTKIFPSCERSLRLLLGRLYFDLGNSTTLRKYWSRRCRGSEPRPIEERQKL